MRHDRDGSGGASGPDPWGRSIDATPDDEAQDPLAFATVIVPARLDAAVARRVAEAASRDGIAIADLLGRAAAAYDWDVADEAPTDRGR